MSKHIIIGLQTLLTYYTNGNGHHVDGEHDMIMGSPTDIKLTDADVQIMIDNNWHQEYLSRDYHKDFEVQDYRFEECWIYYT